MGYQVILGLLDPLNMGPKCCPETSVNQLQSYAATSHGKEDVIYTSAVA
jgi:hypothetical protein